MPLRAPRVDGENPANCTTRGPRCIGNVRAPRAAGPQTAQ